MGINFAELEQDVVQALSALKSEGVRTCEGYTGQLENRLPEVARRFPALYVLCEGVRYKQRNLVTECEASFLILCAARALKTQADEAVHSASYLVERVRSTLHNRHILREPFTPLLVSEERVVVFDDELGIAVCSSRYTSKARVTL